VRKVFKQAQRTHRIVQNLLSFARQRKPQKQEVDLRKVLEESLTLREYDLKVNNVSLEREIPEDLPRNGRPASVGAVFLNIVNNALDAMVEDRGQGVLRCVSARKTNRYAWSSATAVRELRPKRFSILFTLPRKWAKARAWLSICYGIVKEHGGEILARNAKRVERRSKYGCWRATSGHGGDDSTQATRVVAGGVCFWWKTNGGAGFGTRCSGRRGSRGYDFHERSGHAATAPRGRV